mmetsp:Transcript_19351/g.31843  ORF Transcript_19351/g.31843 Transcript_19351/m.31843 type:complete len:80 (-) Transcript_19351:5261-5500(-)
MCLGRFMNKIIKKFLYVFLRPRSVSINAIYQSTDLACSILTSRRIMHERPVSQEKFFWKTTVNMQATIALRTESAFQIE